MEITIKKAQLRIEIKYVKKQISDHRYTINQLQIMGMGLTDELNQLEKKEAANLSSSTRGRGPVESDPVRWVLRSSVDCAKGYEKKLTDEELQYCIKTEGAKTPPRVSIMKLLEIETRKRAKVGIK